MEKQTAPLSPDLHHELHRALTILTGKWKLEILWLLYQRTHRFGELKREIPGVTQHMLTAQLRGLEADGLVVRTIYAEVPLRVEYSLTPAARELEPTMWSILEWWSLHGRAARDAQHAARQPTDARESGS